MEIVGNGIDLTEIARIGAMCDGRKFAERYFTEQEIAYAMKFSKPQEHFAGFFCAKEAFSKAYGTGIRNFSLKDVEVLHDSLGKPFLNFHGALQTEIERQGLSFLLSISHSEQYATAQVLALQAQGGT